MTEREGDREYVWVNMLQFVPKMSIRHPRTLSTTSSANATEVILFRANATEVISFRANATEVNSDKQTVTEREGNRDTEYVWVNICRVW